MRSRRQKKAGRAAGYLLVYRSVVFFALWSVVIYMVATKWSVAVAIVLIAAMPVYALLVGLLVVTRGRRERRDAGSREGD